MQTLLRGDESSKGPCGIPQPKSCATHYGLSIHSLANSFIIPLAYRIGLICGIGFRWLENHGSDLKSKKYNKTLAALGDANLIKIV